LKSENPELGKPRIEKNKGTRIWAPLILHLRH
jgi:hypothetical protein